MFGLDPGLTALLILCLLAAAAFEFINGFHDTANAVATVIYTNSLKPWVAVVWSAVWNSIGVFAGGISVAMGITYLLPNELLLDTDVYHNIALILALLITAILWNLGTWYFGIPCSSSHTLIGSILGVCLAFSFIATDKSINYVNWGKASDIGLSLLLSPVLGFSLAILLMYLLRQMVKKRTIFREPNSNAPPPFWIRLILLLTCTGVSFSHGSNDGQKGVGLVMLILIAIVPGYFTINANVEADNIKKELQSVELILNQVDSSSLAVDDAFHYYNSKSLLNDFLLQLNNNQDIEKYSTDEKTKIRKEVILLNKSLTKILESNTINLSKYNKDQIKKSLKHIKLVAEYAPSWVILLISISLGLGTMIGWKRIVRTIGEKIGKQHLTYAQGASAEIVAASTIGFSTYLGLPVSTTHILSSGIAGSMVASKGVKNLNTKTIKSIAIAWLLTFPVCMLTSGLLFYFFRLFLN